MTTIMFLEDYLSLLLLICIGIFIGSTALKGWQHLRLKHFKQLAKNILLKAEQECEITRKASEFSFRQQQMEQQKEFEHHWRQERRKIQLEEDRIKQREDKLESHINSFEKKLYDIEKREITLNAKKDSLESERKQLIETQGLLKTQLEQIAGLSISEAKEELLSQISYQVKIESANLIRRSIHEAKEEADKEASRIIVTAINRLAVPCVSETTVNTVAIPNEELKGRIIGREGRNIRALERATGINFIIDDTPGAVVLSGFDPVRMQIAKLALTELVHDGRIHPTRIEEVVEKAGQSIQKLIKNYGEDAALRVGAINMHPELISLLGKLRFRYSYGQNVLDHSIEVSNIMGMMASELGLDSRMAKRIGLLHDVGKAVTHEVEGSHAIIGHDLALKFGESKEVANGIGCHHNEMPATTIEGSLCSAADAISASRQGARSESVEHYFKRLKKLEDLACEFAGVEKAYAMQAGREIRVIVAPDTINDEGVIIMARDLAKRIESDLHYPGKIKVTIIREKRFVEYAL